MKRFAVFTLVVVLLSGLSTTTISRPRKNTALRPMQAVSDDEFEGFDLYRSGENTPTLFTSTAVDTYCIVWYDFEQMNWQQWTQVDNTAQKDTFCHVDDFSGLGGGSYGGLVALEGVKSLWCGARDWDHQIPGYPGYYEYLCQWYDAPGYGNDWNQALVTDRIPYQGILTFSYHGYFDCEQDYDRITVEYDAGAGNWTEIALYDGTVDTIAVHELLLNQARTKLRFHFLSDGEWSDADGLLDTDGAFIVDDITISDIGGVIDYENFESWPLGATSHSGAIWYADIYGEYGNNSGLVNNLLDDDPCNDNFTTQIVFIIYTMQGEPLPGLQPTPFCHGPGGIEAPCQDEYVMSPIIDMTMYSSTPNNVQDTPIPSGALGSLGGAHLRFTAYVDLPMQNLVFYYWNIRNVDEITGCPGEWVGSDYMYYMDWGSPAQYRFVTHDIGYLVESDAIQVRLGCIDMCDSWYQVYGNCAEHTPAPWFDNVRIYRFDQSGPQWSWRDLDIFQDNFPAGADIESFVRADAANDLRPCDVPIVDPGDSIVVQCTSPLGGGIDTTADGWPKVYMHCYVPYIGDPLGPKPDLYGPQLAGGYGRYASDDGSAWTVLQCDYARTGSGGVVADRFMVDMNDSLLTRGYQIIYYFKAYDHAGESSTLPAQAEEAPWPLPPDPDWATCQYFFEWTCLPTLNSNTLYVDDYHGRGSPNGMAEVYWNSTFEAVLPPENQPDRYDVNSPTSMIGNGPGSRAKIAHLTSIYYRIVWDSGTLETGTINDGTWYSDKSNDVQMILDWIENSDHRTSLIVCGNGIASDLNGSPSPAAAQLLADYCGVALVDESYFDLAGGNAFIPKITAVPDPGNALWHTTWGDSFYLFQSTCPWRVKFDVLDKTGPGEYALSYPDYGGSPYYAGIYSYRTSDSGQDIRTMWFGFSFMYIRDSWEYDAYTPIMRNIVLRDIISWQCGDTNADITEIDDVPLVNSLSRNFPNPFNPTTDISFGMREKGHVTLRIYDVAGRLVRTLVDEVRDAGMHNAAWDGTNGRGTAVASGVYFYRMKTAQFEQTRKMVLLR